MRIVPRGGLHDVPGFRSQAVAAGIKKKRRDVAVIHSTIPDTACAATFTTNRVHAAPVVVSKRVAARGKARAIVVNSGCANACTGGQGLLDAERMAETTARALGVAPADVLVASTGVIGRFLPMDIVEAGIRDAVGTLDAGEPGCVAQSIMTTDTVPKEVLVEFSVNGKAVRVAGVAKGAGMIHPSMATMLCFLLTDAAVPSADLQAALSRVVDRTFNMISVDGDTSTNDTVAVLANGASGVAAPAGSPAFGAFENALETACRHLALEIVKDGEGATTLIEVRVTGARTEADARLAARSVTKSSLVKTAVFGRDPNWGRVIAAIGYSGAAFDPAKVELSIGSPVGRARVLKDGVPCETLSPEELRKLIDQPHVILHAHLGDGSASATAWGCDLTYEYVKVNADYTT